VRVVVIVILPSCQCAGVAAQPIVPIRAVATLAGTSWSKSNDLAKLESLAVRNVMLSPFIFRGVRPTAACSDCGGFR